jgi:2,4-dienoyl-CoA reductase-like NADH-dependent reductase (Old Yellow Enzyme family)
MTLFDPYDLGSVRLSNRIVMAPMTRSRNADTIANEQTALYYAQRAGAGLIVSEGTTISPEAQGSILVPGIWSERQVAGWSKVTRAVHDAGGKIFAQLWHVGRLSHSSMQPDGGQPVSASATPVAPDPMNTVFVILEDGTPGRVEPTPPRALATDEVARLIEDFATSADHARAAGFDGVEVHGATGYIFEQFFNPHVNRRTDLYGGSLEGRARFALDVVDAIAGRIGADKVGMRLSPRNTVFDMPDYPESDDTHRYLARELGKRAIAYLHLHDVGPLLGGVPLIPEDLLRDLKTAFGGTLMLAGGMTKARATDLIARGLIDLPAIGQPYIANPDLVERLRRDIPLATPDRDTYYGGDAHGYTDYPVAA